MTGSRGAAAYVCNARDISTARRSAPAAAWRTLCDMLRDMVRPGVRIVLDRTDDYTCGACGQVLAGDLREVYGHVREAHGRPSFVLEERAPEPGDCSGGECD